MARVFVAMSGGVDSSVAAALLLEQDHDVTGITMQLWPSSADEGGCCSVSAARDARRVCDILGIPHYTWNFRESFERHVVGPFAEAYAAGRTPNPCIDCNDRLKFSELLARVMAQDADALATGHYARIVRDRSEQTWLARGVDPEKDQSYFLYRLTRKQMEHTFFPVGELRKSEVRSMAARIGLAVAEKPDSQETCFALHGEYAPVVTERHPLAARPGEIVDSEGRVVGHHDGLINYTVGQRKGLRIGGAGEPLYVVAIDTTKNRLVVGTRDLTRVSQVEAGDIVWHGADSERLRAAVRYRMLPAPAEVRLDRDRLVVTFAEPLEGIAPGQAVVCYRDDIVVGGGVIECAS